MVEVIDDHSVTAKIEAVVIEKSKAIFPFENISSDELAAKVKEILLEKGYKLEQGSPDNGKYGKGSQVLRVLFGAFAKRFCWEVKVQAEGNITRLILSKDAKGYAGGLIGVNQVNNEYKRLTDVLTSFHASLH